MKGQSKHGLTEKQRYWLETIKAWEASGVTMAEYAAAQGIDAKAMYAGKKVLVSKGLLARTRSPRFERVQVMESHRAEDWRVQLPNGVCVSFMGRVDETSLSAVLRAAAALG